MKTMKMNGKWDTSGGHGCHSRLSGGAGAGSSFNTSRTGTGSSSRSSTSRTGRSSSSNKCHRYSGQRHPGQHYTRQRYSDSRRPGRSQRYRGYAARRSSWRRYDRGLQVSALLDSAKTPADHEQIAKHYDSEATLLESAADDHLKLAAQYKDTASLKGSKKPTSKEASAHCTGTCRRSSQRG
jgi:hypothetical protein